MKLNGLQVLALATLCTLPLATMAQAKQKPRTITISSTGYVMAQPDAVRIVLGVVTQAKSAKDALAENSKALTEALDEIRKAGVERKDIATSQFNINAVYSKETTKNKENTEITRPVLDGYRVVNNAEITVRDISKLGTIIDHATQNGANSIGEIEFIISDMENKLDDARREAMKNAIRRAKLYTEASGAELGELLSLQENTHTITPRPIQHNYRGGQMAMAGAPPIEAGERRIGVTIDVVWNLD